MHPFPIRNATLRPKSAENAAWDTDLDQYLSSPTHPKPDLYFGFTSHIRERKETVGFREDAFSQNFTVDILSQLAAKGLRSVPVARSLTDVTGKNTTDNTGRQFPLPCFPWCIMQLRADTKATEIENSEDSLETSRQSSIAATGALAMLEKLARFAGFKEDTQHVPPVLIITSAGSNIAVWLAFSEIVDEQLRDHKMMTIWEGCISKIWGALQFCRIIDNLFFWAQHILLPQLSHYIDQWRLHYYPEVPNVNLWLENDLETAGLVHRIQDRLSSLNISPNSDLPGLIRQAIILQEVMRPELETKKPAAKKVLEPSPKDEMQSSKKIPLRPRVEPVAGGVFGYAIAKGVEQQERNSKNEEQGENQHEVRSGNEGNETVDKTCLPVFVDKLTLQSNPVEKKASVLANLPIIDKKPSRGNSTTNESERGPPSAGPEPSVVTLFPSTAKAQQILETGGPDSTAESPTDTNADVTLESKLPFSYSAEFKTSDFEFDQARFLSLLDQSTNADVISEKRYILSQAGPFEAPNLSMRVYRRRYHRRSLALSKGPRASEEEISKEDPKAVTTSQAEVGPADDRPPKRRLAVLVEAPGELSILPKIKIPWKDKHIVVRLPPVMPAPH